MKPVYKRYNFNESYLYESFFDDIDNDIYQENDNDSLSIMTINNAYKYDLDVLIKNINNNYNNYNDSTLLYTYDIQNKNFIIKLVEGYTMNIYAYVISLICDTISKFIDEWNIIIDTSELLGIGPYLIYIIKSENNEKVLDFKNCNIILKSKQSSNNTHIGLYMNDIIYKNLKNIELENKNDKFTISFNQADLSECDTLHIDKCFQLIFNMCTNIKHLNFVDTYYYATVNVLHILQLPLSYIGNYRGLTLTIPTRGKQFEKYLITHNSLIEFNDISPDVHLLILKFNNSNFGISKYISLKGLIPNNILYKTYHTNNNLIDKGNNDKIVTKNLTLYDYLHTAYKDLC